VYAGAPPATDIVLVHHCNRRCVQDMTYAQSMLNLVSKWWIYTVHKVWYL